MSEKCLYGILPNKHFSEQNVVSNGCQTCCDDVSIPP